MSSAVGEDTAQAINSGRETIGTLLSAAQTHLQKVFIVFVIGFMGSFYALRVWIWDFLEETATAEMDPDLVQATDIITRTPFEVILLQAKIGLFIGVLVAIPALLYFSRDALRKRGVESVVPISKWYMAAFAAASISLFSAGVAYAYGIFFPYAFYFLGEVSYSAGVKPSWGITEFTEFVALLTLSFGLAAQLPLFMGVLSYTEIVPYEFFRDKWRHAIVTLTAFGAVFSPPDPFTLIMWAIPLVLLYVFSLGVAKLVANTRRRGAAEIGSGVGLVKRRVLQFTALIAAATAVSAAAFQAGAREYYIETVLPYIPSYLQSEGPTTLDILVTQHGLLGIVGAGVLIAVGLGLAILVVVTIKVLQSPVYPRESALRTAQTAEDVDFDVLDATDIERVPAPVFLGMEEEDALETAREAMYDDNKDKAQAILDRYDTLHAEAEAEDGEGDEAAAGGAAGAAAAEGEAAAEEESGGFFTSTAADVLDPFTEEETTEEDIGGYAYDIAFILNSLTSKVFRIVAVFMAVLAGSFFWLYTDGIRVILAQFVDRVPDSVLAEVAEQQDVDPAEYGDTTELIQALDFVIALHPVEVLIFIVKVSTLAAIISVLPMVLYYGWPAAKERGLVRGDRRIFLLWGGGLFAGFLVGTYLGFFWVAPAVISYLITDAITNGMVVSYRIRSFFWLVIFTTVGIGFLFNIIVTMALFHIGGIVNYRTMLRGWRPVVVGIFTISALVSPKGILTMLLFAIPIALTYVLGLALLYLLTGGGRLFGGKRRGPDLDTGLLGGR
ncbi:twin-arginine translocase subunit TatC [Halobacteria archaeon AArc-dxtr1]|nr:twin-arginine translocase subunit TatC [Halobacteria archaeon AArc-dxtr1]